MIKIRVELSILVYETHFCNFFSNKKGSSETDNPLTTN